MYFDEKLKIFRYHFPKLPILPGALLIDLVLNDILKQSGFLVSARFLSPIYPNQEVEFGIEQKGREICINVLHQQDVFAKLKLESEYTTRSTSCNINDLFEYGNRKETFKPLSNGSEEITFLDRWYILNKNDRITAVGEYQFSTTTLECISDFNKKNGFGQDFFLIEFMSLTVLSALANKKIIDLQDNYGFARIKEYIRYCPIHTGDQLISVVHCSLTGNGIIWDGYVLRNDYLVARISQGVDLPLKKEGDD